ncbi:PQQ-binding-like beta-propeller repeat protein [Nonomuraea sp. NPDC059194]|uniref:outer membrane protein assembly factor BamB family protein n=1 Tax=Nonomuraea sp. NPDC059194 TaxID=3346764 RepID=UPI00369903D1
MSDQHNDHQYGGQPGYGPPPNGGQPAYGPPNQGHPAYGPPNQAQPGHQPQPGYGPPPNQAQPGYQPQPGYGPPHPTQPGQQPQPGYGPPNQGQPGYGPPHQGQPAYGHSQAQTGYQAPEQAQSGYGPATGPSYGPPPAPQPGQWNQQPPYPTGQPYPQQQQPGRPRQKGRTALFVALGLVVLLAVGAGTAWFVAGGGSGSRQATAQGDAQGGDALGQWAVPLTNAGSSDFTTGLAFAAWLTDTTIIRAQKDGLLAYDLKNGKRAWGVPSPGEQLCGATGELVSGKGAVAYGDASMCDHLAGVDAAKGKLTWKIKIPAEKSRLANMITAPQVLSAGDMVVLSVQETVYGHRLSDGAKRWTVAPPEGCHLEDVRAVAARVVTLYDCGFGEGATNRVEVLDPRSGKPVKRYPIGELGLGPSVLSADPVIVQVERGGDDTFIAFDDKGGTVEVKAGHVDLLAMNKVAFFDGMAEERRYAVHKDRLYLASFPENVPDALRSRNTALAFDLKTGRRLWESSGTNATKLTYVRADDKGLLALEVGDRRDLPPRLVRLDAATGKATPVATLPQEFGTEGDNARVFERGGAVLIVPWTSVATKNAVTYFGG